MLKFPSKEKLAAMPQITERHFRKDGQIFAEIDKLSDGRATARFTAAPSEEIRTALKSAGFRFSIGDWTGSDDKIADILALMPETMTEKEIEGNFRMSWFAMGR